MSVSGELSVVNGKSTPPKSGIGDYITLLKPRVMSLVVFTALVGLLVSPVPINPLYGF